MLGCVQRVGDVYGMCIFGCPRVMETWKLGEWIKRSEKSGKVTNMKLVPGKIVPNCDFNS